MEADIIIIYKTPALVTFVKPVQEWWGQSGYGMSKGASVVPTEDAVSHL